MKLLCKECGSTEVRNDRSLEGRLICAKCGSVDLEVSRGRLEFKLPNIKLEALRKTTQKQRAVIAASLIGVAAITAAIKSQDQQYCMDATDGSKVCIKKEGLSCISEEVDNSFLQGLIGANKTIICRGYGTIKDQVGNMEHWATEDEAREAQNEGVYGDRVVCNTWLRDKFFTCGAAQHFGLLEKK